MSTYSGDAQIVNVLSVSTQTPGTIYTVPSGIFSEISFIGATYNGSAANSAATFSIKSKQQFADGGSTNVNHLSKEVGIFILNSGDTISLTSINNGSLHADLTIKEFNKP